MTTANSHEFWGAVFGLGAIALFMGGFWLFAWYVERQARKDAKARWDVMDASAKSLDSTGQRA